MTNLDKKQGKGNPFWQSTHALCIQMFINVVNVIRELNEDIYSALFATVVVLRKTQEILDLMVIPRKSAS